MIYGRLADFEAMGLDALGSPVARAVAWIRGLPALPREGRLDLGADGLQALVLRYATRGADEARFESHRRFVDLQCTLAGGEAIDWAPRDTLPDDGDYDAATDLRFHKPGPVVSRITKTAGLFSLYTPVDAHRGGIHLPGHDHVFKVVVKIPAGLVGPR